MLAINSKQKVKGRGREWRIGRVWPFSTLRKSLFGKYFAACAAVILVCFLFLGAVVVIFSVRASNDQKSQLYQKNALFLSSLVYSTMDIDQRMYREDASGASKAIQSAMQSYAGSWSQLMTANVYITDRGGNLVAATFLSDVTMVDYTASSADNITVPSGIMAKINKGRRVHDNGTLGGLYTRSFLTEGYPIIDSSGNVLGGVFISSPSDSLIGYVSLLIRVILTCIGAALLFAFVAIYLLTLRLVRPLKQMSMAAKSFAKGDFTIRVPVDDSDEVGQLASAFNNMATSLTTLEEMRRSFVANVSHELKTPMTSIAGFIDGILDGTVPPEKREYYLKIVSDEVKRLSRLVRQFLDIARIEAGELKINPSQFDVDETVRRVIVGFEYMINEKHLEVRGLDESADERIMVTADPDLTHQIIYNLVDNAVKFANTGGYIEINVVSQGKKVYVSVKNSGMGIPSAELPYVFDRFYKTDKSRSQDRKGVGLGLYIAKTVLNLQNEDIVVKSEEGQYCEFVFTLTAV